MLTSMEATFQEINKREIHLDEDEVKHTNERLKIMLDFFINDFKTDPFFASIFERCFYGGSFYDGLKVGKPNEFDIDLVFNLQDFNPVLYNDVNYPGFMQVQFRHVNEELRQLLDSNQYLNIKKIMAWFQSKVDITSQKLKPYTGDKTNVTLNKVTATKGPAITLTIVDQSTGKEFEIDFVPCFKFSSTQWPTNYRKVTDSDPNDQLTKEFLVVPKPKVSETHFRLSFQGQERFILEDKGHIKPAIRLLKLYRDKNNDAPLVSYYLKTVALWALEDPNFRYGKEGSETVSSVFLQLLGKLIKMVENGTIPYFWIKRYNLLGEVSRQYLMGLLPRLRQLQNAVQMEDSAEVKRLFKCHY